MAVLAVASTALLAGVRFTVQPGAGGGGTAVVNVLLLLIQPVAAPTAFLGFIYQVYWVAPAKLFTI